MTMSKVALFHRSYQSYGGGHAKVWDYFNHILNSGLYDPRIYFTKDSQFGPDNPWTSVPERITAEWDPVQADLLFVAGMDWQDIPQDMPANIPIINLIQGLRHANPELPLYGYLRNRAIRVCVSQPVADAILATGQVNGAVRVVANGIELPDQIAKRPIPRNGKILVAALKNPALGTDLADQLRRMGRRVDLLLDLIPRSEYLAHLKAAEAAVLLPLPQEGFFLPGLEAMALGTPVIMPDCGGNRQYARDGENCLIAAPDGIVSAVRKLDSQGTAARLSAAGQETARYHSLSREYAEFVKILAEVERLWAGS